MIRIYVGMEDGLAQFSQQAGGWRLETRLDGRLTQCLAYDPLRPERVYCGTFGQGLWRSEDAGQSWQPAGEGITHDKVMAVAVSPLERARRGQNGAEYGVLYAGTEPSALFRSEDGGETWEEARALLALPSVPTWSFPPRPYTHHVRWIELDPVVAGRLYVAIEQGGVMRSLDGGRTFEDRKPGGPRDAHTLATHDRAPGRIYAPAADGMGGQGKALMQSDDGGASWYAAGEGIRHAYGWSVAVDPGDPERVVYSGSFTPRQAHDPQVANSTLYYRHGGEAEGRWQEARDGLPEPEGTVIYVLATNHTEPGVVYAASNKGVFRSADAGRTWERLPVPWPARYLTQHVQGLAVTDVE
jgi:photosystem II stability/assembly factor-like uncharacterized protein